MANVRNMADPEAPTTSNVVIYQMMMHYKRRMDIAEDRESHYKKRMKIEQELYEEEIERKNLQITGLQDLVNFTTRANHRGAAMVVRKHHAGLRLVECLDEIFSAVELSKDTDLGGVGNLAVEYIDTVKDEVHGRAQTAFELLVREHDEVDLDSDEVIDLVTTEEEDSEEE